MWDSHRQLNFISNLFFAVVAAMVLYTLAQHYGLPRFLPLKEVHVQRLDDTRAPFKHITRKQIEKVVNKEIHGNFMTVDLIALRDAFIKMPWVRDAKVERIWPFALKIKLEEHQALAHWGSHALVNTYGEVFRVVSDDRLPVFTGPMEANSLEVKQFYKRFVRILAPLKQTVVEINLSSRHAWRVRLESGTVLELGREEMEARLERYVAVYNQSIAHLNLEAPLDYVDLRYPNGFAIHLPEVDTLSEGNNNARKKT